MALRNVALSITFILVTLFSSVAESNPVRDGVGPVVFSAEAVVVLPGQAFTLTVQLDGVADGTEVLDVQSTSGAFLVLPTTVRPAAGATSVSFVAVSNLAFTGSAPVVVSNNVSSCQTTVYVR